MTKVIVMGDEIGSLHIVLNVKSCWIEMSLLMKTVKGINVPNTTNKSKLEKKMITLLEKMITLLVIFV